MASLYVPGIYSAGTNRVVQAKLDIPVGVLGVAP